MACGAESSGLRRKLRLSASAKGLWADVPDVIAWTAAVSNAPTYQASLTALVAVILMVSTVVRCSCCLAG
jgi:hypothetical protein